MIDSGSEFRNKLLQNFCDVNNVKFIYFLSYRSHFQGVVEPVHRIIKKGLQCHKEDLKEKYNINYSLDEVITVKNETICRSTKKTPNDLFFDKNIDEEEIKGINNLILYIQKYINIYKNSYYIGEKILVSNNLKICNNTLKKY